MIKLTFFEIKNGNDLKSINKNNKKSIFFQVVQILVDEKLRNLSATARKHLFAIIQSIVIHSEFLLTFINVF